LLETTTAAYVIASKCCHSINSSPGPFVAEKIRLSNKTKLLHCEVSELAHVLQSAGLDCLPVALLIRYWVYGKGIVAAIEDAKYSGYMQL